MAKTIEQVKEYLINEIKLRKELKNDSNRGSEQWRHHDSWMYAHMSILDYIDSEDANDNA